MSSLSVTEDQLQKGRVYVATLTSDAGGDASQTMELYGNIMRVVTNPDDAAAPTADYDLVLNDVDGVDIMAGGLANRHTSTSEQVLAGVTVLWAYGVFTLVGSNMGDTKTTVVKIYTDEDPQK